MLRLYANILEKMQLRILKTMNYYLTEHCDERSQQGFVLSVVQDLIVKEYEKPEVKRILTEPLESIDDYYTILNKTENYGKMIKNLEINVLIKN